MIKHKCTIILGLIFCSIIILEAQTSHKLLRKGNRQYNAEEFRLAEENFRKSIDKDDSGKSAYNLGNSLYKQERYEEAIEQYQNASSRQSTDLEKAQVYHNMGNAHFHNQEFEEAIEAYKQAIRINPQDDETIYNMLMTKQIMKMQQQQQEQQQQQQQENSENSDQEQEQQEQEENSEQDSENSDEENESQSEQEEEQESEIQEGGGFDSTRLEKQELDSLDAIKLLQIVESEEQKVQEKLKKFNSTRKKQDKDW